jgi:hypothetical protein
MPTGTEDFKIVPTGQETVIMTLTDRAYHYMQNHYKNAPKLSRNEFVLAYGTRDAFIEEISPRYTWTT